MILCGKKVCDKLELHRNYFFSMKHNSPELFNYLCSINKNFAISYPIYVKEVEDIYKLNSFIYYYLKEYRMVNKLSVLLSKKGIYKHKGSYITSNHIGITESRIPRLSDTLKLKQVFNVFKTILNEKHFMEYYEEYRTKELDILMYKYLGIGVINEL